MGFRKVTLGLRSLRSRERGSRIPSGTMVFSPGAPNLLMLGHFSLFFRICSAFFGFPHSSWLFPSICFHFSRFFFDFSSILGRFREDFSMIFDTFSKHAKTCGSQQNTAWAHEFGRSAPQRNRKSWRQKAKKRCECMIL